MDTPCEIVAECDDRHVALVLMRAITADTGCPHTITAGARRVYAIRRLRRHVENYTVYEPEAIGHA